MVFVTLVFDPCSSLMHRFVDNSQNAADVARTNQLLSMLHKRVMPVLADLEPVLAAFDNSKVRECCRLLAVISGKPLHEGRPQDLRVGHCAGSYVTRLCSMQELPAGVNIAAFS